MFLSATVADFTTFVLLRSAMGTALPTIINYDSSVTLAGKLTQRILLGIAIYLLRREFLSLAKRAWLYVNFTVRFVC